MTEKYDGSKWTAPKDFDDINGLAGVDASGLDPEFVTEKISNQEVQE